jgi:glucan biosynthesis protein
MRKKLPLFILIMLVLAGPIAGTADKSSAVDNAFYFDDVIAKAEQMAHKPYQPPQPLPSYLGSLTFDQWRNIVFRNDSVLSSWLSVSAAG